MAYVTFEDLRDPARDLLPRAYRSHNDLLHGEEPLLLKGTLDGAEDSAKVHAHEVLCWPQRKSLQHAFSPGYRTPVRPGGGGALSEADAYPGTHELTPGFSGDAETLIYLGEDKRLDLSLP
jgi:hypothetical protein